MSKIELKLGIFIEGFDEEYQYRQRLYGNTGISNSVKLLYQGKTSEIPEEITRSVCELQDVFNTPEYINQNIDRYKNYEVTKYTWYDCTVKESIKSACPQKYCIIYKIK